MKTTHWIILLAFVVALAVTIGILWPHEPVVAPTNDTNSTNVSPATNTASDSSDTTPFTTSDLPDRDPHFSFSLAMPTTWAAEYVASARAINFFDPSVNNEQTPSAKTQVFVLYYEDPSFKPSSNDVLVRELTVDGQPARHYTYRTPDALGFESPLGYPIWVTRSDHQVVHVQTGPSSPYTYLVLHQSPDLPDATFLDIINSLDINP